MYAWRAQVNKWEFAMNSYISYIELFKTGNLRDFSAISVLTVARFFG